MIDEPGSSKIEIPIGSIVRTYDARHSNVMTDADPSGRVH